MPMKHTNKTRDQLIEEIHRLQKKIADLSTSAAALRQSENKYKKLFDHAGDAILLSDGLRFIDCNKQALMMFRCSKEQLKPVISYGNTFSPMIQPDGTGSQQKALKAIHTAVGGRTQHLEWRYRRYDGTLFDADVTLARIILEGETLLLSIIRDVTKRKRAEKELLGSRKMFQALVENSLGGIFIVQNEQMVYANPEQKRLFGPVPPSFRLTTYEGIYPEDVPKVRELHRKITSGEAPMHEIVLRFYPIGKTGNKPDLKVVYCRASVIEYEGTGAVLFTMMDITRARELEQLLHTRDKMTSLGRIAAGMAHEIRNPLSGININLKGLAKIVAAGGRGDDAREIIDALHVSSQKIEDVVKRVMDFAKPNDPRFVLADANHPVREAMNLAEVSLRKNKISLETDLAGDLPRCFMDPRLIEQVVLNLINNASDALRDEGKPGTIRVTTRRVRHSVLLTVDDSGPGVPAHDRSKIFDPFYTTRTDGAGIGLSISSRIITDHGGSLSVSDGSLGGAQFLITIPIQEGNRQ